jgi:sec-independent protein translocase protein TatA
MIGPWQWVIILVIVMLLFGSRIPGIARSLGSGLTAFRRGLKDGNDKPGGDKPQSGDGA